MEKRIEELGGILSNFCDTFGLKVCDDVFFKEVLTCYRGEEAGRGKTEYKKPLIKEIEIDEPATEKQKKFIYGNNIDVDTEILTKKEAFFYFPRVFQPFYFF